MTSLDIPAGLANNGAVNRKTPDARDNQTFAGKPALTRFRLRLSRKRVYFLRVVKMPKTFDEWLETSGEHPKKTVALMREAWDASMSVVKADNMASRKRVGVTNICHRLHQALKQKRVNIQRALWDVEFLQTALCGWYDSPNIYSQRLKDMVQDVIARAAKDERLITGKQRPDVTEPSV